MSDEVFNCDYCDEKTIIQPGWQKITCGNCGLQYVHVNSIYGYMVLVSSVRNLVNNEIKNYISNLEKPTW